MKTTATILDKIVATKRERLVALKQRTPFLELTAQLVDCGPTRNFYEAVKGSTGLPGIIAEVKQASPSAGTLREPFDIAEIIAAYQQATNVVALSIITEEDYFQGSDDRLRYAARHNRGAKPLLRKDFIFDIYQIAEARLLGADAFLLIAALFDQTELQELVAYGQTLGLEPLVEVHDADELNLALATTCRCIGVNARDLRDFSLNNQVHNLLDAIDPTYARVAESGVDSYETLKSLEGHADTALIGSYFMKASDITEALVQLTGEKVVA